jgi:hypothetical protein
MAGITPEDLAMLLGQRALNGVETRLGLSGLTEYCTPTLRNLAGELNKSEIDLRPLGWLWKVLNAAKG